MRNKNSVYYPESGILPPRLMRPFIHNIITTIIQKFKTISLWHFVWFSVLSSEIFTAIMSLILRGGITYDYLITGCVVSLIVSSVVIYLIKHLRRTEQLLLEKSKLAEGQLTATLREKEILLQEIHHRVKNNMQIISSLLRLQSRYINDPKDINIFKECQNRIHALSLVHEKLYRSKNLASIDFGDYAMSLAIDLFRSYKVDMNNITLSVKADEASIKINTIIPCGLIITELISNSLKYAFPDNKDGVIMITLQAIDKDRFVLTIKDNGAGIPEYIDFRNTETLGLQLVNDLVKQIKATIELNRTKGTEFQIRFNV